MGTRNSILSVVAVLVVAGASFSVFAAPVFIYGGDFDLPIPANPDDTKGWMQDAIIEIPDHFNIYDLDVRISLKHTSVFDLQIFLQSPSGIATCLNMYDFEKEFFKGQDYIGTIFDDEAETPIEQGEPPFTGRFKPRAGYLLEDFDGEDAYGPWRLRINDARWWDTGSLNRFELTITVPEPATAILLTFGIGLLALSKPNRSS